MGESVELGKPIERISANTLFSYISQFWYKALSLILLPIIVSGLGKESYGLYTLVVVVIGYYALMDLGISSAVVKYVSEYNAKGQYEEINTLVSTSLQAHFVLGVLGCVFILSLTGLIVAGLDVPVDLRHTARIVLYVSAVQFLLSITTSVFTGILNGLQRIDLVNKISILFNTVMVSSIALLARFGYGLVSVVLLSFFCNLAAILTTAYFAKRTLPTLRVALKSYDLPYVRRVISFGMWTFVIQAGTLIHFTTDRLLIGLFFPISFVTYFAVAVKLAEIIRSVPMPVVGVLFPAVSDLKARGEESAISEILLRGTKYVLSLSIPISIFLFVFSRNILSIWMGPEYGQSSGLVLMLFAAGYLLNTLTFVNTSVLLGLGAHRLMALYCIAGSSLNLGLDLALIPRWGINGAAIASLMAFLLTNPALAVHSMRNLGIGRADIMRTFRKPMLCGVLTVPAAYLYASHFRPGGWPGLIAGALVLAVVYYGSFVLAGGFDNRDRLVLRKFIEVSLKSTPLRTLIERR
jgi:O-antigen/teichoic acid export membrane protein